MISSGVGIARVFDGKTEVSIQEKAEGKPNNNDEAGKPKKTKSNRISLLESLARGNYDTGDGDYYIIEATVKVERRKKNRISC